MASNNDYSNSENILVKVDQNNLIYIDPNSVVDSSGEVQPRGHKQENLVMYLNLEADLIPRTTLISDDNVGNTLTQVASGNLNFLRNATGDGNFDTSWTDAFVPKPIQGQESTYKDGYDVTFGENQFKDPSGQTFGIDSVNITVKGANYVPQVTINFVDVRGKTLFESSENSPYRAFFHLPWPIFYLTVKGYYGKAIRYRLHMTKFSSKFNESNGNFEISTTFVGSTFAWMNDIPLSAIINCPYMFLVEETKDVTFNEKTGLYEKRLLQSSRGYTILKSIYRQYEAKGLIPKGFPVRTLREMGYIAETLDKVLEQEIFSLVGVDVFQGIKELDETITDFENSIKSWAQKRLSDEYFTITNKNTNNENNQQFWYYLSDKVKTNQKYVVGDESGSLEKILKLYNDKISQSKLFTESLLNKVDKKTGASYANFTSGDFTKISIKKTKDIKAYASLLTDKKVVIHIDGIFEDIFQIRKSFEEQRKKVEDDIEYRMNEIIKGKEGFGFEPTIRNMFAVLLANAEVYIRLMKDTHNKAFQVSNERKKIIGNLSKESKGEDIYPWPEIKKPQSGGKENVVAYPGDEQLVSKLRSNDKRLWPEVDFVEEFINIVTNRTETNLDKEPTRNNANYVFESDEESNKIDDLSGIDVISETIPYIDKSYSSFVYELYERARYLTMFDSFNNKILTELANEEFKNIKQSISGDYDLIELSKTINDLSKLIDIKTTTTQNGNEGPKTTRTYSGLLSDLSPFDKFNFFKDNLPTTDYISDVIDEPFKFESYVENATNSKGDLDETKLNGILKDYEPEKYRMDIYPFNSTTYLNYIGKQNFTRENFKFNGILKFDTSQGLITSPINVNSWLKNGTNNTDFFSNTITINGNKTSILNTPYFHNQLYSDFNKLDIKGKYAGSSYLLLNSLPFIDLDEQITFDGVSILTSSLFREVSATHFLPYHLILKWGSIYHRYKKHLIDGIDILDGSINSSYVVRPISGKTLFDNNSPVITYTSINATSNGTEITVPSTINIQVGMKLVVTSTGNGQFSNNTIVTGITNSTTFQISQPPLTPLVNATIYGVFDEKSTFNITPRVSTINGSPIGVTYTPYLDIVTGITGPTTSNLYNGYTNVGVNPHYQSIYSQIVNGYSTYDPIVGRDSYEQRITTGGIQHRVRKKVNRNYWDVFMDNSKYISNDKNYTLLPSIGDFEDSKIKNDSVLDFSQELSFKTLWYTDDIVNDSFSGKTFPSPHDYFRTTSNQFSLSSNYKKALDLIGTFSPDILEYFESFFLDFSTQKLNDEVPYEIFRNINYSKFQDILKKLTVVEKLDNDVNDVNLLVKNTLKQRQRNSAEKITSDLLSGNNLIKFTLANPKEIDPFILYGFTRVNSMSTYNTQSFNVGDVNTNNLNLIKLYIGEDIDGHYLNFFNVNNIKLTEENIKSHRQLILIYAGYIKSGGNNTKKDFVDYLTKEVILKNTEGELISNGSDARFVYFMAILLKQFVELDSSKAKNISNKINFFKGYNTDQTKVELYNTFKSFNDKWTAGNSIGQRLLLEEFLFLDKANRDIGDKLYLNIDKFLPLLSPKNSKTNLYSAISMMIQGTGLDMRALPAYVNFYGNNLTNKNKITPSKKVAATLFGTFLEVDYQDATPKIIIQLVGQSSKRLDMSNSKPYKFNDDSFYVGSQNNNPLLITNLEAFSRNDLSKSNRVVAFEVSFGDQNQGIFKGLTLDQSSIKNTSESFEVLENLAGSASGAGTHSVDVSLFDYYKQASYRCDVSAMGNVMIQPTMFFYLKNIPMFRGSYWITEVNHSIKSNTISTTFTGTRLPYTSLPDPKDSFVASYRILFDKIQSKAIAKFKQRENTKTETQEVVIYQNIPYVTDRGNVLGGRNETIVNNVGINKFGVPFNGFNNVRSIQLIENNGQWLRGIVVQIGGKEYNPQTIVNMNIANGVKFSDLNLENDRFYMTKFQLSKSITPDLIRTVKTTFKNPKNNKQIVVSPDYQLDPNIGTVKTNGPIAIGPPIENYGLALSKKLMEDLRLVDGDVVYFRME
jgi:hypothetical protein